MVDPTLLLSTIVTGLFEGGVYAIVALGLALIYGVMRILNIAHGDFMIFGGYIVYWLFRLYGIDPLISMVLTSGLLFLIGFYGLRFVVNPSLDHPEVQITSTVLITYGLALLLSNGEIIGWNADFRFVRTSYQNVTFTVGGLTLDLPRLLVLVLTVATTFIIYLVLFKTNTGLAIRASTQDRTAARLVGIDFKKIAYLTLGVSNALAGVAGSLFILTHVLFPAEGLGLTVKGLTVIVFGGLGSLRGALVGGLVLGIVEAVGTLLLASSLKDVVTFGILVLVLLIRPTGLFGKKFFFPK